MKFNLEGTVKVSKFFLAIALLVGFQNQAQAATFAGSTSAQWGTPLTPSPTSVISITSHNGNTNNRLTWGETDPNKFTNYVQFDGTTFSAGVNSLFNLGTLSYRNGSTYTYSNFDGDFPLQIALSLTLPFASGESFNFLFNILNTPNTSGNPVLDGDRLRFSTAGLSSQKFNYQENDYTLQLMGFSTNGGKTIAKEFNSPEGSVAIASLYGKIISDPKSVTVPEPASFAGLSLLGIYFAGRRRK